MVGGGGAAWAASALDVINCAFIFSLVGMGALFGASWAPRRRPRAERARRRRRAVGRVFGRHLVRGGVRTHLLVRSGRQEAARDGLPLWRLRLLLEASFQPTSVCGDPADAARERWDLISLCVASTALRGSPPAPRSGRRRGHPGLSRDGNRRCRGALPARSVGMRGRRHRPPKVLAWEGPLAAEIPHADIACWAPPLAPLHVSGSPARSPFVQNRTARGGSASKAAQVGVRRMGSSRNIDDRRTGG